MESSITKKLWHMFHIAYYTLRKGFMPKRKLMMDLHLLLKSGKTASKALNNLLTFNHHHHRRRSDDVSIIDGFSCRSMDPTLSFYDPREVEFSCSNTPSYPSFLTKRINKHRSHRHHHASTAAAIVKAFEMLNDDDDDDVINESWARKGLGKSPATVRVSDSPFPIKDDEAPAGDCEVDRAADEFIRRFYHQLRRQKIAC